MTLNNSTISSNATAETGGGLYSAGTLILNLAMVMDLYSRRIVGWAMDTTLAAELP